MLHLVKETTGKAPSILHVHDLDAPMILQFLDYLEHHRGHAIRVVSAIVRAWMVQATAASVRCAPVSSRNSLLAFGLSKKSRPYLDDYASYTYPWHMKIVWDPEKARENPGKHGIAFPDAEPVLFDPRTITREDEQ